MAMVVMEARFLISTEYAMLAIPVETAEVVKISKINRIEIPTPFVLDRVNCYYIEDSKPTLIDAGVNTQEAFDTLTSGINRCGGAIEGIKRIILTHAHADHIGLLSRIVGKSGADVYIHRLDAPKMLDTGESGAAHLREKYRTFFVESGAPEPIVEEILSSLFNRLRRYFCPFEQVRTLSGSDIFSFDSFDLETIHTPGHSPGSICMFNREDGTLFSGDSLLEKITSNPVVEVNPSEENRGYRSLEKYKQTLAMLDEMPVKKVLPGHGEGFSNHRKRIRELLDHHEERAGQIIGILRSTDSGRPAMGGMTRFMIMQRLFHNLKGMDVFLGLSETQGSLQILERSGLVFSEQKGNQEIYFFRSGFQGIS